MIPNTKLLDKVIRIFVRTGPTFGDVLCDTDRLIEVDVNVFGRHLIIVVMPWLTCL